MNVKHLSKIMLLALGFGLFAVVLSYLPSRRVVAAPPTPSLPVDVTNTPLPVQGTVSANQSGAWTVGVNNLPSTQAVSGTVNIGNFPASTPISFSNTSTTPLFVDTDLPARENVSYECTAAIPSGGAGNAVCAPAYTVPSGQILVVDSISFFVYLDTGSQISSAALLIKPSSGATQFFFPLIKMSTNVGSPALDGYAWSGQYTLYFPQNENINFAVITNDTGGEGSINGSFYGHLVTP
jgi:hypothetical protein